MEHALDAVLVLVLQALPELLELEALGRVLAKHPGIVIGADDMYEHIYWATEPFVSLAAVCPELYDRIVTTNGVSKAYAMTGWRIGYCGGPVELITAMATIQGQSTSNPSSIAQKAAVVALNADQSEVREMNKHFKQRHDFIVDGLNKLPGVSCLPGAGTFYAFAQVEGAMKIVGAKDDNAFAEYLLSHAGVAVVPGSGFGAPGHMRLSFACSMKTLEGDHVRAHYHVRSGGRRPGGTVFPSLGSVISMELGKPDFPLPNYVLIKDPKAGTGGGAGSGFLGPLHQPLVLEPEAGVPNLRPAGAGTRQDTRMSLLKAAEGRRGTRSKLIKPAREAQLHAMAYAYRGRKERKRQLRALWITRLNAAARLNGITYSRLVAGLRTAGVVLDRKVLADIAVRDAATFTRIAEVAKSA